MKSLPFLPLATQSPPWRQALLSVSSVPRGNICIYKQIYFSPFAIQMVEFYTFCTALWGFHVTIYLNYLSNIYSMVTPVRMICITQDLSLESFVIEQVLTCTFSLFDQSMQKHSIWCLIPFTNDSNHVALINIISNVVYFSFTEF